MKLKEVLGLSNAKLIIGNEQDELTHFSKDTRTIKENDTYVAIIGENFDGNKFFKDAFLKGAKTCIVSSISSDENLEKYRDKNILLVDNTIDFLVEVAKLKRSKIQVPVIAVTGSVGKTSTKNLIASVLEQKYSVLKTQGNLNTKIGLALTILNYQNEECIVLEMGMSQFGEISTLTNIAKPTIAVITNIGTSHIGNLGSRENILKAKLEITEGLNGPLLINNDNDLLHEWKDAEKKQKIITFGIEETSDYQAKDIKYLTDGCSFRIKNYQFHLPVYGDAFIYNSLVAFIIGEKLNVSYENIASALNNIPTEEHRMQKIETNGYIIIDDTYNASFDSIRLALDVLSNSSGRKIAVLGDILELGDFSRKIHKDIGSLIVKKNIDLLVTVGPMAKYINEKAKSLGFSINKSYHFDNNKDAIKFLKETRKAKDIILVKASHGMNFKEIVEGLHE